MMIANQSETLKFHIVPGRAYRPVFVPFEIYNNDCGQSMPMSRVVVELQVVFQECSKGKKQAAIASFSHRVDYDELGIWADNPFEVSAEITQSEKSPNAIFLKIGIIPRDSTDSKAYGVDSQGFHFNYGYYISFFGEGNKGRFPCQDNHENQFGLCGKIVKSIDVHKNKSLKIFHPFVNGSDGNCFTIEI
jgi:hypothetical protein